VREDVRDRELGDLLEGAVGHLEPNPDERLARIRRRGATRRALRWTAIGTTLAMFLGGLGWSAVQFGGGRDRVVVGSLDPSTWTEYHRPVDNWSLRYPSQWNLQPYTLRCFSAGGEGALISNVRHHFEIVGDGCAPWDMRGLPPNLVVVEVGMSGAGPFGPFTSQPDSRFPLSLDDAKRVSDVHGEEPGEPFGAPQPRLYLPVSIQGQDYAVNSWLGRRASRLDREIVRRIVASIRFGRQAQEFPPDDIGPSPGAPPAPYPTGPYGYPAIMVSPPRGPVGTRVHVEGDGFTEPFWSQQSGTGGGYQISLERGLSGDCDRLAFQVGTYTVNANGHLTGDFVVPSTARCPEPDRIVEVVPGKWTIKIACAYCEMGDFEVTKD
jgi:hypothetical protein